MITDMILYVKKHMKEDYKRRRIYGIQRYLF